ncbi:MAG: hypothetical protein R2681_15815 [Pyrinomonadaceae bacterium]
MKKTDEENIPNIKRQGWSAREIVEQAANEESDDVVEKISEGDKAKKNEEKRSLVDILFPPKRYSGRERESSALGSEKTGKEVENQ